MSNSFTSTFSQTTNNQSQSLSSAIHSGGINSNAAQAHNLTALFGGVVILGVIILITIVIYVFYSYFLGLLFRKAGRKMWPAFIPIYNLWVLFEITDFPAWLSLLSLVPFISFVISIIQIVAMYRLTMRLSKSVLFFIFGVFLFPIVGLPILALGSSVYTDPKGSSDQNDSTNEKPPTPNDYNQPTPDSFNTTQNMNSEVVQNQETQSVPNLSQEPLSNDLNSNTNLDLDVNPESDTNRLDQAATQSPEEDQNSNSSNNPQPL